MHTISLSQYRSTQVTLVQLTKLLQVPVLFAFYPVKHSPFNSVPHNQMKKFKKVNQKLRLPVDKRKKEIKNEAPKRVIARRRQKPRQSPGSNRIPTPNRTDESQPLYRVLLL